METNGDDKAYPISATAAKLITDGFGFNDEYLGLTKRELFSYAALQGLLGRDNSLNPLETVKLAVLHADYLIDELNK